MEAEFAGPAWVFGQSYFQPLKDGRVAAVARSNGRDRLYLLRDGEAPLEVPLRWAELDYLAASGTVVAAVVGSATEPNAVAIWDVDAPDPVVVRSAAERPIGADWISIPQHVEFPTADGQTAHALLYEPVNPTVAAPEGERPPLVLISHGGPTSNTVGRFNPGIQFFTTRGFAVVDVDYGGSTGYGREYRNRLRGQWGIVDLEDCVNAARWLAWRGTVDGSAHGHPGRQRGRLHHAVRAHLHGRVLGRRQLLRRRRPGGAGPRHAQVRVALPGPDRGALSGRGGGLPASARRSTSSIASRRPCWCSRAPTTRWCRRPRRTSWWRRCARNGVPYAYLLFEGEGHGFRRAENIRRSLEAELSFYGQVFGFTPADDLPPLNVERPAPAPR